MTYTLVYHPRVVGDDIPRLGPNKGRIAKVILSKLTTRPELFGRALTGDLRGYRKLRVGDYRVIFWMEKNIIHIDKIGHRSTVYKERGK